MSERLAMVVAEMREMAANATMAEIQAAMTTVTTAATQEDMADAAMTAPQEDMANASKGLVANATTEAKIKAETRESAW